MNHSVPPRRALVAALLTALPGLLMLQGISVLLMHSFLIDFPGLSRETSSLLLAIPFLCFFLVRTSVTGKPFAACLHIAVFFLYLAAVAQRAFPVFILQLPFVISLLVGSLTRLVKGREEAPAACAVVCLLCAGSGYLTGHSYGFLFLSAVLAIVLALAGMRMSRLNGHIRFARDGARFLSKRVFGFNDAVTLVLAGAVVSVSALAYLSATKEAAAGVPPPAGRAAAEVTLRDEYLQEAEWEAFYLVRRMPLRLGRSVRSGKDPFPVELPPQVLIAAIALVLSVILVMAVLRYRSLQKSMGETADIVITKMRRERRQRGRQSAASAQSEKIRRMFYKKVKQHLRRGLKLYPRSTSSSIAVDIGETEDIGELERLYREARYGE